ncbi:MAG: hypothetical protein CMJ40_10050 [Phycisphaerae bacterium]|nr:hypothetical protein [Phycisphaerae bacterium]
MNKTKIFLLLLFSIIGCCLASPVASAQSVRVPYKNMDGERESARVQQGDHVTITFQSGKRAPETVTGKIVDIRLQGAKFIKLDTSSGEKIVFLDAIRKIVDADAIEATPDPEPSKPEVKKPDPKKEAPKAESSEMASGADSADEEIDPDKKGLFVLRLTGTVGLDFRPEEIEEIVRQADERGPGQVIVLEINSGGGSVAEGMIIRDVILDACKRHRMVAWIEKAVSCASWTALCCDEIVFKKGGYTGGITIMIGRTTAPEPIVKGWINNLGNLLRRKNRPAIWAVPFVLEDSYLSATKDPVTGSIEWFNDPEQSGEMMFSEPGKNLYFDYRTGVDWNLAVGVAQNEEELAELLKIGDWELAGTGRKLNKDLVEARERITTEAMELNHQLQNAGNDLSGINTRIKILKRFLVIMRQYPNIAANVLNLRPNIMKVYVEDQIEELEWQKRQMR